jgi:transketolase
MPNTRLFDQQDAAYKESVLPAAITARVAVEAGIEDYWARYVGLAGKVVGMSSFGESAPGGAVMQHFGFTAERVAGAVREALG